MRKEEELIHAAIFTIPVTFIYLLSVCLFIKSWGPWYFFDDPSHMVQYWVGFGTPQEAFKQAIFHDGDFIGYFYIVFFIIFNIYLICMWYLFIQSWRNKL